MTGVHRRVDPSPVIGAVIGKPAHRGRDLVEQGPDHRCVINRAVGQRGRHDPAGGGIDANVQLLPRPPHGGSVLFDQPLPRAGKFQSGAVDQQMDLAAGDGCRRQPDGSGAPPQGGMIGNQKIEAEQLDVPVAVCLKRIENKLCGE